MKINSHLFRSILLTDQYRKVNPLSKLDLPYRSLTLLVLKFSLDSDNASEVGSVLSNGSEDLNPRPDPNHKEIAIDIDINESTPDLNDFNEDTNTMDTIINNPKDTADEDSLQSDASDDIDDNDINDDNLREINLSLKERDQSLGAKTSELFECSMTDCDQSFITFRALQAHSTRKHKIKIDPKQVIKTFNRVTDSSVLSQSEETNSTPSIKSEDTSLAYEMTGEEFKCSVKGCDKCFTNFRALGLHSRRKHRIRLSLHNSVSNGCNGNGTQARDSTRSRTRKESQDSRVSIEVPIDREDATPYEANDDVIADGFQCSVEDCRKCFASYKALSLHSMRKHQIRVKKESIDQSIEISDHSKESESIDNDIARDLMNGHSSGQLECPYNGCGKAFATRKQLEMHSRRRHKIGAKELQNKIMSFSRITDSDSMASEDTNREDNNGLTSDVSQEIDSNCIEVDMSNKKRKKSNDRFDCLIDGCHRWFGSYRALTSHSKKHRSKPTNDWNAVNGDNVKLSPNKDKKKFKRKLKYTSITGKPYLCDICGKRFRTKAYVFTHKKLHKQSVRATTIEMFTCTVPGCQVTMANVDALRDHMMTHSDQILSCKWQTCSAMFATAAQLKGHMISHKRSWPTKQNKVADKMTTTTVVKVPCSSKPARKYCCEWPGCDQTFDLVDQWKEHAMWHHDQSLEPQPEPMAYVDGYDLECQPQPEPQQQEQELAY